METSKMNLDVMPPQIELPDEILKKIFEFLPNLDHHIVSLVSKRFQNIIDSIKFEEPFILKITEKNLQEIKSSIENKSCKLNFKRVVIEKGTNILDLEFILQSIGKRIEHLSMRNTAALKILKCNVINLKYLELSIDNDVKQAVIGENKFDLNAFPFLEEVSFSRSGSYPETTNVLLEQLQSPETFISLKELKVTFCETEDVLIKTLLSHKNTLESLEIDCQVDYNKLQWSTLYSSLKKLKNLRFYCFNQENVNKCLTALSKQNKLEILDLFPIDDTSLTLIANKFMDSLQNLNLSSCEDLTDAGVKELVKLTKLRFLKLGDSEKITRMGFLAGIAVESNLYMEELYLEKMPKLDELGLRVMVSRFPNLRVLNLDNLEAAITNKSMASIFRFLTRLRILSINNRFNITDEAMIGFGINPCSIKRLRLLEELSLDDCLNLTDQTLIKALHLPELRSLLLGNCHKITLKGIEIMVEKCPSLEVLRIPSTAMIDDKVLFVIGNGLKHLRELYITDCALITQNICDHIMDVFEALKDPGTNTSFDSNCLLNMNM